MTRLVLVRHGRTEWNRLGRIQGQTDVDLDEVGVAQAAAVAPYIAGFEPVAIWSSDLSRASATAARIAVECGLLVRHDERLRERGFGEIEGLSHREFAERSPGQYDAFRAGDFDLIDSAENSEVVAARLHASARDLGAELEAGETAVIVSHGAALKLLVGALIGLSPAASVSTLVGMDNCAWAEVELRGDAGRLVAYNRGAPAVAELSV
ncbi:histidine phosphatase family protein [Nocardioides sp.]|uniref:histidine phosphatase family protein n=1 Tax=Nocardioides sp. TaxID=35761 RepID=UPI00262A64A1|nr:histidine phosphatase family protein [Nocardioides sp.]